jgi:hypothetical protein
MEKDKGVKAAPCRSDEEEGAGEEKEEEEAAP